MDEDNLVELYLNKAWRPNLSITGAEDLPDFGSAKNVVRTNTKLFLSMRLCPEFPAAQAEKLLREKLTTNVPYNA